jgi:hypothetical protein
MPDQHQETHLSGIELEAATETRKKITIEHAESYLYSNVAGVSISPMDIRIDFADVTAQGKTKTVAGITLSPEHAAQLVLLLMTQLQNFEKDFGDIRTPHWKALKEKTLKEALKASPTATE